MKSGRGRGERKPRGEEQREGKMGRGEGRGRGRRNGFVEKDYLGGEREIDFSPPKLDDNAKINA